MNRMIKKPLNRTGKNTPKYVDDMKVVKDYLSDSSRKFARWGELEGLGVSQSSLRALLRKKVLVREGYGRYALSGRVRDEIEFEASQKGLREDTGAPGAEPVLNNSYLDSFAEVAAQVPRAVVSLLSASAYHNLTLDVPFQVWIALKHGTHRPKVEHPPIKPVMRRLLKRPGSLTVGVDTVEFEGVPIQITNLERTVVDLYDYDSLPDPSMPRKALLAAMARPEFDRERLLKYARHFGVREKIRPDVEFFDLMSTSRGDWDDEPSSLDLNW